MQPIFAFSHGSTAVSPNRPECPSPLLDFLGRGVNGNLEDLKVSVGKEVFISSTLWKRGLHPFPALQAKCAQLPPAEAVRLCVEYFVPFTQISGADGIVDPDYVVSTSRRIAELTIQYGAKALQGPSDCSEIHLIALQIRDLMNCYNVRAEVIPRLNQGVENANFIRAIARTFLQSELYGQTIVQACIQRHLNSLQSLILTRTYLNSQLSTEQDPARLLQIPTSIIELIVKFGLQVIEECSTPQHFEVLANEIHSILDTCPEDRPRAIQLLSQANPAPQRALLLKEIINGCRGRDLLVALVRHRPTIFFAPEEWDSLAARYSLSIPKNPAELWLAFGGNGAAPASIVKAATELLPILSKNVLILNNEQFNWLARRLVVNLKAIDAPHAGYLADQCGISDGLVGINPSVIKDRLWSPHPPSPLMELVARGQPAPEEQMRSAALQEVRICEVYCEQNKEGFPFLALAEKCDQLPADQGLALCVRFFTSLAQNIQPGTKIYYTISSAAAELTIDLTRRGIQPKTDCFEIAAIVRHIQSLLGLCGTRAMAVQRLGENPDNPVDDLITEIAKGNPDVSPHGHAIMCAANLRGLNPLSALNLARDYLCALPFANSSHELGLDAATLAIAFGLAGLEQCNSLSEFDVMATGIQSFLNFFGSSPQHTLYLLRDESGRDVQLLRSLIVNEPSAGSLLEAVDYFSTDFFSDAEWSEIQKRCLSLGLACPKRLLLAAAAHGPNDSFIQYAFNQLLTLTPQDAASLIENRECQYWLAAIFQRVPRSAILQNAHQLGYLFPHLQQEG
jgi:hypothetical protein